MIQPTPIIPLSVIQTQGPRPEVILGYLVGVCRSHFSNKHQTNEALRNLLWVADAPQGMPNDQHIMVDSSALYSPASAGRRPAVTFQKGEIVPQASVTIGDRVHGVEALYGDVGHDANKKPIVSDVTQELHILGTVRVNVSSVGQAATEVLSQEVWELYLTWMQILRDELDLLDIKVSGLSAAEEEVGAKQRYYCRFVIQYTVALRTMIRPDAAVLKSIRTLFKI